MIDSMVKTRVEEFHRRHGGVCFRDDCHWYYPDGAYRDVNPLGVLAEPWPDTPEGLHRNASNILAFYRLKFEHARRQFNGLHVQLENWIPNQPSEALAELRRLQGLVETSRKELAAAQKKFSSTEIEKRRQQLRRGDVEERIRIQAFHEERRKIQI
jgi:hypothetical protein